MAGRDSARSLNSGSGRTGKKRVAIPAIGTAVSGLLAAQNRLQIAATNIVNANTTSPIGSFADAEAIQARNQAFQPKRAHNISVPGGVSSLAVDIRPPTFSVFSPDDPNANEDGIVGFPNVSLAEEFVQLRIAAQTYKANATVIRTALEIEDALLDAFDNRN